MIQRPINSDHTTYSIGRHSRRKKTKLQEITEHIKNTTANISRLKTIGTTSDEVRTRIANTIKDQEEFLANLWSEKRQIETHPKALACECGCIEHVILKGGRVECYSCGKSMFRWKAK